MRTEQSLREALEFLAERAEQTEQADQPEAARTPVRRVRRSLVLAAVAATVAAAVLVPVALDRKSSPPPVTENTTLPPEWTQQWMTVQPGRISRTYSANRTSCFVTEYLVNSFDLAKHGKLRKKTTVNGHPADLIEKAATTPQRTHLRIAWRYRTGRWALADCSPVLEDPEDLDKAEQRVQTFADSVDFGPSQFAAPVDFGYLPPGARVQSISVSPDFIEIGVTRSPTEGISVGLRWPSQTRVLAGERPVQIDGRPARVGVNGFVRIPYGTFDLTVRTLSNATDAERQSMALAVAKGVRVADPKDRSTWFPAVIGLSPK